MSTALLLRLKIVSLENQKKEARLKYQEHRQAFVYNSLGRPMEKLQVLTTELSVVRGSLSTGHWASGKAAVIMRLYKILSRPAYIISFRWSYEIIFLVRNMEYLYGNNNYS